MGPGGKVNGPAEANVFDHLMTCKQTPQWPGGHESDFPPEGRLEPSPDDPLQRPQAKAVQQGQLHKPARTQHPH